MSNVSPAADSSARIYTLSQVASSIQAIVAKNYPGRYWIKAEMARLHRYPHSGHCYPDLVEKSGDKVVTQFRAIIWGDIFQSINQQFIETAGKPLQDGMNILFLASVNFHPQHGLSLHIHEIEPSFTLGEMTRQRAAAISRLKKEGNFDLNRNLPFPTLPSRIAVISVETSKGYHDFCNILQEHGSRYNIQWELFPALLQGVNAGPSIIGKLEEIDREKHLFDVVTIIRGGGGEVGLDCYDEYTLSRVVARFPIPVITGIGHSTNLTIVEMVAHSNKITPTDVAYSIVDAFREAENALLKTANRINNTVKGLGDFQLQRLDHLGTQMVQAVRNQVTRHSIRLNRFNDLLPAYTRSIVITGKNQLLKNSDRLEIAVKTIMTNRKNSINVVPAQIFKAYKWVFNDHLRQLTYMEQRLRLADPEVLLKRGYSITSAQGQIIRSVSQIKPGTEILTRLTDGTIISTTK